MFNIILDLIGIWILWKCVKQAFWYIDCVSQDTDKDGYRTLNPMYIIIIIITGVIVSTNFISILAPNEVRCDCDWGFLGEIISYVKYFLHCLFVPFQGLISYCNNTRVSGILIVYILMKIFYNKKFKKEN